MNIIFYFLKKQTLKGIYFQLHALEN